MGVDIILGEPLSIIFLGSGAEELLLPPFWFLFDFVLLLKTLSEDGIIRVELSLII